MSSQIFSWSPRPSLLKFSRDNEQLFALNYENLCDSEYLNKLFTGEITIESDQNNIFPWALTPDLPEDILVFSNSHILAQKFILSRSLHEESSIRSIDTHSEIVLRQIRIFEHIGQLVIEKIAAKVQDDKISIFSSSKLPANVMHHALTCALKIAEKGSRTQLTISTINSLMSIIQQIFHSSPIHPMIPQSPKLLPPTHSQMLKNILCNGVRYGLSQAINQHSTRNTQSPAHQVTDSLRLALVSSYNLLKFGLQTSNPCDILLSMCELLAISLFIQDKQQDIDSQIAMNVDEEFILQEKLRLKSKVNPTKDGKLVNHSASVTNSHHAANLKKPLGPIEIESNDDLPNRVDEYPYEVKLHKQSTSGQHGPPTPLATLKPTASNNNLENRKFVVKSSSSNRPGPGHSYLDNENELDIHSSVLISTVTPPGSSQFTTKRRGSGNESALKKGMLPSQSSHSALIKMPASNSQNPEDHVAHTLRFNLQLRSNLDEMSMIPKDVIEFLVNSSTLKSSKNNIQDQDLSNNNNNNQRLSLNGSSKLGSLLSNNSESKLLDSNMSCKTEIWTCGQNSYGELGHGDSHLRCSFARVSFFENISISCIGAGNEHSLFITNEGKIYVCGYNDNGQCGIGTTQQVRQPTLIPFLDNEFVTNVFVYNGCEHSLVTTKNGEIYSFGYNYRGQLGLGITSSEPIPRLIKGLNQKKVILAACSYHHSILVCHDNSLYSFGRNDCGQLGHNDTVDRKLPQLVTGLDTSTITSVSCGQFHSVLVHAGGSALVTGKNDYGQIGIEGIESTKVFTPIQSSTLGDDDRLVQVCCGYYHTILLSQNGYVYGFGRNDYGQLGLGHTQPRMYGVHFNTHLRDKNVVSLAAGCYHSIAVTANGMLYVFGRNNHGQLGTGDVEERHLPHPVDDFIGKQILQVAAGFYHTIILLSPSSALPSTTCKISNQHTTTTTIDSNLCNNELKTITNFTDQQNSDYLSKGGRIPTYQDLLNHINTSPSSNLQIRELFMFLVQNIEKFNYNISPIYDEENTTLHIESIISILQNYIIHLRVLVFFLQITKQSTLGSLGIDLPLNHHEMLILMLMIVNSIEKFYLQTEFSRMMKYIQLEDVIEDEMMNYTELLIHQTPIGYPILSTEDLIQRILSLHDIKSSHTSSESSTSTNTAATAVESEEDDILPIKFQNMNLSSKIKSQFLCIRKSLLESIIEMRKELLCIYFFLPDSHHDTSTTNAMGGSGTATSPSGNINENIFTSISHIISKNYHILFSYHVYRCDFILFLTEYLMNESPSGNNLTTSDDLYDTTFGSLLSSDMMMMNDSFDYLRCLKLFLSIYSPYQSTYETLQLFQNTPILGLEYLSNLFNLYYYLSKLKLDYKFHHELPTFHHHTHHHHQSSSSSYQLTLDDHTSTPITYLHEIFHQLHLIEILCINFLKCSLPMIYHHLQKEYHTSSSSDPSSASAGSVGVATSNPLQDKIYQISHIIFQNLFVSCENILNLLLQECKNNKEQGHHHHSSTSNDEEMLLFYDYISRHNNVLSYILPTFILYSLSYISLIDEKYSFINQSITNLSIKLYDFILIMESYHHPHPTTTTSSTTTSTTTLSSPQRKKLKDDEINSTRSNHHLHHHHPTTTSTATTNNNNSGTSGSSSVLLMNHLGNIQQKDFSQLIWWNRLFKLMILFNTKLSSILLTNEKLFNLKISKKQHQSSASSASSSSSLSSSTCPIWNYFFGPSNIALSSILYSEDCISVSYDSSFIHDYDQCRNQYSTRNFTYKTILMAAKSSNILPLILSMEYMIASTILNHHHTPPPSPSPSPHFIPQRILLQSLTSGISEIILSIFSKRTQLLNKILSPIMTWNELLKFISRIIYSLSIIITSSVRKSSLVSLKIPFMKSRNNSQILWRKALLYVICCNRWKSNYQYSLKKQNKSIIQFYSIVLEEVLYSLEAISPQAIESHWQDMIQQLIDINDIRVRQTNGLNTLQNLLNKISTTTTTPTPTTAATTTTLTVPPPQQTINIQIDIIVILINTWKEKLQLIEKYPHDILSQFLCYSNQSGSGGSGGSMRRRIFSYQSSINSLITIIQQIFSHYCLIITDSITTSTSTSTTPTPSSSSSSSSQLFLSSLLMNITLCCNILKLFQLFFQDSSLFILPTTIYELCSTLYSYLLHIDHSLIDMQSIDDKGTSNVNSSSNNSVKKANSREKAAYFRRTSSIIVNLFQIIVIRILNTPEYQTNLLYLKVLEMNISLLEHYQKSRQQLSMNTQESNSLSFSDPPNTQSSKGPPSSSCKTNTKDTNAHRRRCQELIVAPMQFNRLQEGFVVQGEKLLSNCKGIDFTLSFWIFLTKKTISKYNFLVGKVSHNDAWPLITLRGNDMKIEVIYGRANEFERLISQTSLSLYSWVHIATVIDPRKIRLFINGNMDCQATTAGNVRAVLYPVIIGACPNGVRTRVEYIREGFDGLISSLKYYTRALSPIHVRVVYDQGPPEAYDVRERLSYQLLSTCKSLIDCKLNYFISLKLATTILNTSHLVFLADSSRLKYGSLRLMRHILQLNIANDMIFSINENSIRHHTPTSTTTASTSGGASIMNCDFLDPFETFQERIIYYFIKMIGVCWIPSYVSHGSSNHLYLPKNGTTTTTTTTSTAHDELMMKYITDNEQFSLFLSYCPSFISMKHDCDSSTYQENTGGSSSSIASGAIEIPVSRDDLFLELSQNLVNFLRSLTQKSNLWIGPISNVLKYCLLKYSETFQKSTSRTTISSSSSSSLSSLSDLYLADIYGTCIFLGDLPSKPFLGSLVHSSYYKSHGIILNIDKTTTNSTILTINSSNTQHQLITLKLNELIHNNLTEYDEFQINSNIIPLILHTLEYLTDYLEIIMTDFLSIYQPDHILMKHVIFQTSHPIEIFFYYLLNRRLSRSIHDIQSCNLLEYTSSSSSSTTGTSKLLESMFHHICRTTQYSSHSTTTSTSNTTTTPTTNQLTPILASISPSTTISSILSTNHLNTMSPVTYIPQLWMKSCNYLSTSSRILGSIDYSSSDNEKSILDFISKHVGIIVESFQSPTSSYSKYLKNGYFTELIYSLSCSNSSITEEFNQILSKKDDKYLQQDSSSTTTSSTSTSIAKYDDELHEQSIANIIELLFYLRESIIINTRNILNFSKLYLNSSSQIKLSWRVSLWQQQSHQYSLGSRLSSYTGTSSTTNTTSAIIYEKYLQEATTYLSTYHEQDISFTLINCLRYLSISFFHPLNSLKNKSFLPYDTTTSTSSGNGRNILLTSTDLFNRFLQASYIWIQNYENKVNEGEICLQFLKILLPSLTFIENIEIELSILSICSISLHRIIICLLNNWIPSNIIYKELYELVKSNHFLLLWSRAQEQLILERGQIMNTISLITQQLLYLVSNFIIIQRNLNRSILKLNYKSTSSAGSGTSSSNVHSMTPRTPRTTTATATAATTPNTPSNGNILTKLQYEIIPISPKIISFKSNSVEIDVSGGIHKILESDTATTATSGSTGSSGINKNSFILIEIGLRVHTHDSTSSSSTSNLEENSIFETIYYGTSSRIIHTGLCPNSIYCIRCRYSIDGIYTLWSSISEFKTELSFTPFIFDTLKCGPDIVISQDGRSTSYTGDDNWSTVLGNYPLTTGINSWEIKIISSSTAYLFVGVATSAADLSTFLGGCTNGWGFIGEQALYHGREKVKIYGEPFSTGDIVGVILDFNNGTLSFTRNGKSLGIAFDKIYGELYPAVAFYNVGQEVEIVCTDPMKTFCPPIPFPCSPSIINLDEFSIAHELLYSINTKTPLSPRLLELISDHVTQWSSNYIIRRKTISGLSIFLSERSNILQQYGLQVGDHVRTQYGIAEIIGCSYGRVWFRTKENKQIWYFSKQQIITGRLKGYFQKCSYERNFFKKKSTSSASGSAGAGATTSSRDGHHEVIDNERQVIFDIPTIQELLDPQRWSPEIDNILIQYLIKKSNDKMKEQETFLKNHPQEHSSGVSLNGNFLTSFTNLLIPITPYDITCDEICDDFRTLQQQLSRIVIDSVELSHKWGITGPKRKAVLARIGMLRYLNHLLDHLLPLFSPSVDRNILECSSSSKKVIDEMIPQSITIQDSNSKPITLNDDNNQGNNVFIPQSIHQNGRIIWPIYHFNWMKHHPTPTTTTTSSPSPSTSLSLSFSSCSSSSSLISSARSCIFTDLKISHFWKILNSSIARVSKTDDDYDYPEDLPIVKINRFKSFRAYELSELSHMSGEDLLYSSMFCQLWKELRQYPEEKLRISYTHPMDDGQSRTFKIKFEGEGVDDYGGPYREIFQKLCEELQLQDPTFSFNNQQQQQSLESILSGEKTPSPCFLPILFPTKNWNASSDTTDSGSSGVGSDDIERYKYIFHPSSTSSIQLDLFTFLGQFVGIALRSKITLNLPLASYIWKSIVREPLTVKDIASYDITSSNFINYLITLYNRLTIEKYENSKNLIISEIYEILQDVTWCVEYCNGEIINLIPNGQYIHVNINELEKFLTLYIQCKLQECYHTIEAFRYGLLSVIPESAINILCWYELEQLICGSRYIDIDRLMSNTEYDDDISINDQHIQYFWEVLHEFTEEEKSLFLRFVWARPTLPPKDIEFPQKLKIQSAVGDDATLKPDQYLPKAHTCFFSINLPRYSSKTVMAEKLRYAIIHCTEMDADFRVTDPDVVGWTTPSVTQNWSTTATE